MALTFRAAAPADVAEAVPLIYSSGPAAFDYVFDSGGARDALGFLRFAYLQGGGEFGWRNHHVAEMAGQVAATGAAFDGRAVPRFTLASALQRLRFYGPIHAWGVMVRGLRTESASLRDARCRGYKPTRPVALRKTWVCGGGVAGLSTAQPAQPCTGPLPDEPPSGRLIAIGVKSRLAPKGY